MATSFASISTNLLGVVGGLIAALSITLAAGLTASALRRGVLKQLRIGAGGFEIEVAEQEAENVEATLAGLRLRLAEAERGKDTIAATAEPVAYDGKASRAAPDGSALDGGNVTTAAPGLGRSEKLLTEYHALGLAQSRVMFWFSVIFASLGFALIALTVVVTVNSSHPSIESGNLVSLISGAIVEAVSALFFVQSNRARALMTAFFDRLRSDQSLDRALTLADDVPDDLIRSRLKAVLAFSLADASPSDAVIEIVLGDGGRASIQALPSSRADSSPAGTTRTAQ